MKDLNKMLFGNLDMSPEGVLKRRKENYMACQSNLENMSYWLPKVHSSIEKSKVNLAIPETLIVHLDFDRWRWLTSDNYKEEAIAEFNEFLKNETKDFREGKSKVFMKTGIFSNKFQFDQTEITNDETIGSQLLDMFYTSMIYGASETAEIAFREFIETEAGIPSIYNGMPLNTEYRVFYDFDNKKVLGVSNYWHPEVMEPALKDQDLETYLLYKNKLVSSFQEHKDEVSSLVHEALKEETSLKGSWSVDILKSGKKFWLIDMARMERSALRNVME